MATRARIAATIKHCMRAARDDTELTSSARCAYRECVHPLEELFVGAAVCALCGVPTAVLRGEQPTDERTEP